MGLFFKKRAEELSDEELAARYRESGDKDLVGMLFKRYTYTLTGLAYKYLEDREDARDLVMQVFEKLMIDLREHKVEQFKPWLMTVTRNAALMELRQRKSQRRRADQYHQQQMLLSDEDMESDPDLHLIFQQGASVNGLYSSAPGALSDPVSALQNALAQLNPMQKSCLELFYLHRKSYQEVADETGFSLNQVKSHLQNGKRNLRNLLGEGPARLSPD